MAWAFVEPKLNSVWCDIIVGRQLTFVYSNYRYISQTTRRLCLFACIKDKLCLNKRHEFTLPGVVEPKLKWAMADIGCGGHRRAFNSYIGSLYHGISQIQNFVESLPEQFQCRSESGSMFYQSGVTQCPPGNNEKSIKDDIVIAVPLKIGLLIINSLINCY